MKIAVSRNTTCIYQKQHFVHNVMAIFQIQGVSLYLGQLIFAKNLKLLVLEKYEVSGAQTLSSCSTCEYNRLTKFERRRPHIFRERAVLNFWQK